ncbi:hypothetical protein DM860_014995 [Cuscuta australis]|uniref:Uncharacterized protein n=1 Tax=Cuscuta australis TaxID=267555 RepID=A0A328DEX0_9ASTE|nr:hypothetical protein DM860_014995 [Cuscuta australis]
MDSLDGGLAISIGIAHEDRQTDRGRTTSSTLGGSPIATVAVLPEFLQVEAFAKLRGAIWKAAEAQVDMPIVGAISLVQRLINMMVIQPLRKVMMRIDGTKMMKLRAMNLKM